MRKISKRMFCQAFECQRGLKDFKISDYCVQTSEIPLKAVAGGVIDVAFSSISDEQT